MARTDIHRPSSELFDPEEYECFGVFDTGDEWGQEQKAKFHEVTMALKAGYRFASHQQGNVCGHCGARLRYVALMGHTPTMEMIYVGETCLDNRFNSLTKGEFQKLRKAAQLDRERHALRDAFNALCEENPIVAYATYADNIGEAGTEWNEDTDPYFKGGVVRVPGTAWSDRTKQGRSLYIMSDVAEKARRYGNLSAAQINLLEKIMTRLDEQEAKLAQRQEEALEAADVPTGKILVEGRVLTTKLVENHFSPYGGSTLKMLVQHESGWKVWGTVPATFTSGASYTVTPDPMHDVAKGDTVRFNANVEASEDDSKFGYFKRPTKAVIVAKGESDE